MVCTENAFVPFQSLVTITNMAIDFSQRLDPAQRSFCKNVMWESHDLGSVGKDVLLPNLNLSFLQLEVCVFVCVCVGDLLKCWAPKPRHKSLPFVELKVGVFIRLEALPLLFSQLLTFLPLPVLTLLSQSQGTGSHFKTAKSVTDPHVFPTHRMLLDF